MRREMRALAIVFRKQIASNKDVRSPDVASVSYCRVRDVILESYSVDVFIISVRVVRHLIPRKPAIFMESQLPVDLLTGHGHEIA